MIKIHALLLFVFLGGRVYIYIYVLSARYFFAIYYMIRASCVYYRLDGREGMLECFHMQMVIELRQFDGSSFLRELYYIIWSSYWLV